MRILILFLCFIQSISVCSQTLKKYIQQIDPDSKSLEIIRCQDDSSLVAVISIHQKDWWEKLHIVKVKNHTVLWEAAFDSSPDEQSIRSVKQIKIAGLTNLYFQVYGQTHMGNGFYYLYELKGKQLLLRASTRAVDRNREGGYKMKNDWKEYDLTFKNDTLTPVYNDLNGDGISDIELTGVIQILYDEKIVQKLKAKKALIYRPSTQQFTEDKKQRVGFTKEDD